MILIATGSEVSVALEAHAELVRAGIQSRVVSMPCWELFDKQSQTYRDRVLPPAVSARVSIEAASSFGWERYVGSRGAMIGVDRFGESALGPRVMREFGFTVEHIVQEPRRTCWARKRRPREPSQAGVYGHRHRNVSGLSIHGRACDRRGRRGRVGDLAGPRSRGRTAPGDDPVGATQRSKRSS